MGNTRDTTMVHQAACSHCGEVIDVNANFCRHCGSSDQDGWGEDGENLLEDDGFDYDDFVRDHLSGNLANTKIQPVWRIVAMVLLALMALGYMWI